MTKGAGAAVLDQAAFVDHEVRVALNIGVVGVVIQVASDIGEPLVVVRDLVAEGSKLGDPNGKPGSSVDSIEVLEEVVAVVAVPVDSSKVNSALSSAEPQELGEPGDALTWFAAVGDGRSADAGLAGEGVHVLDVGVDSLSGLDIALTLVVGLVEAEESSGPVGDGLLGVVEPGGDVHRLGSPHHRNELNSEAVREILNLVPSVGPADLGVASNKTGEPVLVVVGKTALLATRGTGGSSCGHNRSRSDSRSRRFNNWDHNAAWLGGLRCRWWRWRLLRLNRSCRDLRSGSGSGRRVDRSGGNWLWLSGLDSRDQGCLRSWNGGCSRGGHSLSGRLRSRDGSWKINGSGRSRRRGSLGLAAARGPSAAAAATAAAAGRSWDDLHLLHNRDSWCRRIVDSDSDPVGDNLNVSFDLKILLVKVLMAMAVQVGSDGKTGRSQENDALGMHCADRLVGRMC